MERKPKRKSDFDEQNLDDNEETIMYISFLNQIYPQDLLESMNSMEKLKLYKLIVNISKVYNFDETIEN